MQACCSKRIGALLARVFATFWTALVLIIALSAQPAAAPFAYVANSNGNFCAGTVSVLDTGGNPPAVVATIGVGLPPRGRHHPGRETRLCRE